MPSIKARPENIEPLILLLRGEKVLLSEHLAELYSGPVKVLNQAVKRNISRFPDDFMFQLTRDEAEAVLRSRSQIVTLKRGKNIKYLPYAFTEQGIAMLSSVLRSPRAVEVNIAIMRTFVQLRRLMDSNRNLARRIDALRQLNQAGYGDAAAAETAVRTVAEPLGMDLVAAAEAIEAGSGKVQDARSLATAQRSSTVMAAQPVKAEIDEKLGKGFFVDPSLRK